MSKQLLVYDATRGQSVEVERVQTKQSKPRKFTKRFDLY